LSRTLIKTKTGVEEKNAKITTADKRNELANKRPLKNNGKTGGASACV